MKREAHSQLSECIHKLSACLRNQHTMRNLYMTEIKAHKGENT